MAWFEQGTVRVYYEEEGSGDPLLLIPGITLSIEDLQTIRQALTPHYHVIAADPPGSGRSGPQPVATSSVGGRSLSHIRVPLRSGEF